MQNTKVNKLKWSIESLSEVIGKIQSGNVAHHVSTAQQSIIHIEQQLGLIFNGSSLFFKDLGDLLFHVCRELKADPELIKSGKRVNDTTSTTRNVYLYLAMGYFPLIPRTKLARYINAKDHKCNIAKHTVEVKQPAFYMPIVDKLRNKLVQYG